MSTPLSDTPSLYPAFHHPALSYEDMTINLIEVHTMTAL